MPRGLGQDLEVAGHRSHFPLDQFLNLGAINVLGLIILCCDELSVCYRMFSTIPSLHPLDASSIVQVMATKGLQTLPNVL